MATRTVTAWIVPLKGHAFDLEDLPLYLDASPVSVVRRGTDYFLYLSTDVAGPTHERVSDLALDYVGLINGAASVLMAAYRPVELDGGAFYGIDAEGQIAHTVVSVGTAELRCKAGHVGVLISGVAQPDPRKGSMGQLLREAAMHPAKADALTIVGRPMPNWSELYLVFELVEANEGSRMYAESWITRSEANLFSRTANSYTALGRAGRHGKDRGDPPRVPMQQREAITLMRSLVAKWVNDRSSASRNGG